MITDECIAELELLLRYDLDSSLSGIKLHHDARPELIEAAQRLHAKELLSQRDGGYLTALGREAAEHAQATLRLLQASKT